MRNDEARQLLRCSEDKFKLLQAAFKQQMEETYINGKPFLGQLVSEVDEHGGLHEAVWDGVAQNDPMLRAILSGARWDTDKPKHFERDLKSAKAEMLRRLNGNLRHNAKKRPDRNTVCESSTSSAPTPTPKDKRRSRLTRGRPYPVPLKPAFFEDGEDEDDPRDGLAPGEDSDSGESVICLGSKRRSRSTDSREIDEEHDLFCDTATTTELESDPFIDRAPGDSAGQMGFEAPRNYARSHSSDPPDYHASNTAADAAFFRREYSIPPQYQQQPAQQAPQHRPTLSARIQEAVDETVAVLEARVTELEEDRDQRDAGIEAKIMGHVERLLAERDEQIRTLRAELDDERSWRNS